MENTQTTPTVSSSPVSSSLAASTASWCFLFLVVFLGISAFESNDISNTTSLHMAFAAFACFLTVMLVMGTSSHSPVAKVVKVAEVAEIVKDR